MFCTPSLNWYDVEYLKDFVMSSLIGQNVTYGITCYIMFLDVSVSLNEKKIEKKDTIRFNLSNIYILVLCHTIYNAVSSWPQYRFWTQFGFDSGFPLRIYMYLYISSILCTCTFIRTGIILCLLCIVATWVISVIEMKTSYVQLLVINILFSIQ